MLENSVKGCGTNLVQSLIDKTMFTQKRMGTLRGKATRTEPNQGVFMYIFDM